MPPPLNIADFQERRYDDPPCWLLVSDIYTSHLGLPVREYKTVSNTPRAIARAFRVAIHKGEHGFSRDAAPSDYALVMLGKTREIGFHHIGLFYEGKVLHATPSGTLYQDMASLGDEYQLMEFWKRADA